MQKTPHTLAAPRVWVVRDRGGLVVWQAVRSVAGEAGWSRRSRLVAIDVLSLLCPHCSGREPYKIAPVHCTSSVSSDRRTGWGSHTLTPPPGCPVQRGTESSRCSIGRGSEPGFSRDKRDSAPPKSPGSFSCSSIHWTFIAACDVSSTVPSAWVGSRAHRKTWRRISWWWELQSSGREKLCVELSSKQVFRATWEAVF